MVSPSLIVVSVIFGLSNGYSHFKPNCPVPPPHTNYVSGPNVRGTMSILWNCLSIILLCTWNIQHLNVPAIKPEVKKDRFEILRKLQRSILDSIPKFKWMMFTIFVPEFLMGKALGELVSARYPFYSSLYSSQVVMFKDTIAVYLANSGYFVLDWDPERFESPKKEDENQISRSNSRANTEMTVNANAIIRQAEEGRGAKRFDTDDIKVETSQTTPSIEQTVEGNPAGMEYVLPLGTKFLDRLRITADELREDRGLSESTKINISRLKSRFWALNYDQWIQLYRRIGSTYIDKPDIPSLHLNKVDRGGALVKALALIQVSYLIIQLISRKIGGLPSTQLEIATLAFAVCSLITYLLYWSRPQEVQTIHIIKAKELIPNDPRDPFKLKDILKTTGQSGPVYLWLSPRLEPEYPDDGPTPIPNDASSQVPVFSIFWSLEVNYEILTLASGALFGGTIFGGLHCLAWNFHFPTPEEALGWRICSIATTVLPVLSLGPIIAWMRLNPYSEKKRGGSAMRAIVASIGLGFCMLPYALARLYLLVEVFRTLCFAPPEVFVDTWSGSFPHIGG